MGGITGMEGGNELWRQASSSSFGAGGWGRRGWMDRKGETEKERRWGECKKSNPGGEPHCRADQRREFCLTANLLFWSGVMAVTPLLPSVCWSVHCTAANSPIDSYWATLINFLPEIMASSEESASRGKTLRKTFPYISRMAKASPSSRGIIYCFLLSRLCPKNEIWTRGVNCLLSGVLGSRCGFRVSLCWEDRNRLHCVLSV